MSSATQLKSASSATTTIPSLFFNSVRRLFIFHVSRWLLHARHCQIYGTFLQSTVMNIQVISSSRMHFNVSNALQHNKLYDCRGFSTLNPAKCCHQSDVKKLNATTRVHWAFCMFSMRRAILIIHLFSHLTKKIYKLSIGQ